MYWNGVGSEAEAFTTTVYSSAPFSRRVSTTSATVEAFCPIATYTHRTWRLGSPLAQLSRWAVIASIAAMPVCSGSFTGWRWTTVAAWISRSRVSSAGIGPLPSSGRPSASTTRPRNPSPTRIDRILPVCLTGSPSSICEASPRMMQPISSSSRLEARPRTPPGNSSSSLDIARGSPWTRAIPSPVSITRPTSSRATEGFQLSTLRRKASAMLSGSKFNAISSHAPQPLPRLVQSGPDGPVEDLVAHTRHDPADDPGVDDDLDLERLAAGRGERLPDPLALLVRERDRSTDLGDRQLPALGRHGGEGIDDLAQLSRAPRV